MYPFTNPHTSLVMELPPDSGRYVLATERTLQGYSVPVFGAMRVVIGEGAEARTVSLFGDAKKMLDEVLAALAA